MTKKKRRESATEKVGQIFGVSGRTVEKRLAVCEAARKDPAKYGHLVEMMDRGKNPTGAHHTLKVLRAAEQIRKEPPPLPGKGPYKVLVADPPWSYAKGEDPQQGATHYPRMSIDEICAMPVASIAHKDSTIFLWTTNRHLPDAFRVLRAWGFEYRITVTWVKDRPGQGGLLMGQTEHCLIGTKGKPTLVRTGRSTRFDAPVGEHSRKPEEFYQMVEELCPAPRYGELFSRHNRPNWDGHGNDHPLPGQKKLAES